MSNAAPQWSRSGTSSVAAESEAWMIRQPARETGGSWIAAILIVSFVLAGGIRLYNLSGTGVLADRDFTSAIIARDFFFQHSDNVEPWRMDMASATRQNLPTLEPPVTEFLVSMLYGLVGREEIRLARLLTIAFWLLGGVFLYRLARLVTTPEAALVATLYYLFVPSGVLLSKSFQPDALMMLTFLASLYAIWLHHDRPTSWNLVIAGSLSGLTLLHRPLVLFALLAAFGTLAVTRHGARGMIRRDALAFGVLALLPPALYYGYGTFIADFMRWKVESSFRPHLLLYKEFWVGWFVEALDQFGSAALIGALAGVGLLRRGASTVLIVALGIGYVVFGLFFTMHIHTHGYYHAQLIPALAIPLGTLVTEIVARLRVTCDRWYRWLPAAGAMALVMWFCQRDARDRLTAPVFVFETEQTAREIGDLVGHSKQVVFLAPSYGLPLQYLSEITGAPWPRSITYWLYRRPGERSLTVEERLGMLGFTPDYFVITDFRPYQRNHADLAEYLDRHCTLVSDTPDYLIYGSCATLENGG